MDNNGKIIISSEKAVSDFSHSTVSADDLTDCGYKDFKAPVMSRLIRKNVIF